MHEGASAGDIEYVLLLLLAAAAAAKVLEYRSPPPGGTCESDILINPGGGALRQGAG
jgi:hypothetical protein